MVKKQKSNNTQLERLLAISGFTIVIVGCIGSLYGAYINQRFIHDLVSSMFYFGNLVVLGGGFTSGYFFTRKADTRAKLFNGVMYAFLALALYSLLFSAGFVVRYFLNLAYPWSLYLFQSPPFVTLLVTAAIAYFTQYRARQVALSSVATWTFICSFVTYQLYVLSSGIYYQLTTQSYANDTPLWLNIGGYIATPLFVAVVALALLSKMKSRTSRLFYATFVGSVAAYLPLILWNFQTDPSVGAVTIFQGFTMAITLLVVALLLLKMHKIAK